MQLANFLTKARATIYYTLLLMFVFMSNLISDFVLYAELLAPVKIGLEKENIRKNSIYGWLTYYFSQGVILIYKIVGLEVYIKKPKTVTTDRCLWISNHRSKLDGLLVQAFICAAGCDAASITKEEVEKYPIFGTFARHAWSIFIKRNRQADELILKQKAIESIDLGKSIIIFPEGATLSPDSKSRSDKFAIYNNLPLTKNLLVPKTFGYSLLKEHGKFDKVANLTIKYDEPSLMGISEHTFVDLFKIFPRKIYIDIEYLNIEAGQLCDVFATKDANLDMTINKDEYSKNTNYSKLWMAINVVSFIGFYTGFFLCPSFRYVTLVLTLASVARTMFF